MESSSENSFAWTDTSSDSFNSTSMVADNINENVGAYDENLIKGKKSVGLEPNVVIKEEKTHLETKSNSSLKKKNHIEPDSDHEKRKKKKKIKTSEPNGDQNDSQDSMSYDETYLNMKVKQEDSSASSSTKHKKKKQKHISNKDLPITSFNSKENNSSNEINEVNDGNVSLEIIKTKKKKKKSKKQYDSDNQNQDVEEKMDIDDTVVNKNKKRKYSDTFVTANTTLEEQSEESGCGEISAIKCDDSQSTHKFSFTNNTIEEENTKVNYSDSLNIGKQANRISEQNSNKQLEATKHRKQQISDRIRFEDDDDEPNSESTQVELHSENNKQLLKLKQFLKINPSLKLLPQTFNNNAALTQDDEIWILKCPKKINILDFNNKTLNMHGKSKIKVGGESYEGHTEEEQLDIISLLTMEQNKHIIKNLPLGGIVNLRKRIPKAHFHDDNIMVNNQTNFIPLPETKCRHPLFGSNYKKAIKIPTAIADRLSQNVEETLVRNGKRKKKKNKKERNSSEEIDSQIQSDVIIKKEPVLSVGIKEKKKKKRKLSDSEGSAPNKVKRIKHDPESAEAWESEKAIEENLFNF